jgi:regulator of replication initiation timing
VIAFFVTILAFALGTLLEHRVRLKDGRMWRARLAVEQDALERASDTIGYLRGDIAHRCESYDRLLFERDTLKGALKSTSAEASKFNNEKCDLVRESDHLKCEVKTLRRKLEQIRQDKVFLRVVSRNAPP